MTSAKMNRRNLLAGLTLAALGAGVLQACSSAAPAAAPTTAPAAAAPTSAPAAAAPTSAAAAAPTTAAAAAPTTAAAAAPTTAAAAAPTTAPAATTAPSTTTKATLAFSDWWGDQFPHYIPMMQQKTGIAINEQQTPWSDYEQKLLTQLVSGTAPDLFLADVYWNGDLYPSGNLVPFDDYLKTRSDVDLTKFNAPQVKENGYQGKTMGLSLFTAQDLIVHVNLDLADAQGLSKDLPLWGTPAYDTWNWQKFTDWLKSGTKNNADGTVSQYGLGTDISGYTEIIKVFTYQNGGTEFDDGVWNYGETKLTLDQPPAVEAIQTLADWVTKYKLAPTAGAEKAINGGSYRAKRALATINWSTPSIFPGDLFKQTWFQLPFSKSKTHRFGANYFSVNKASKQTDAAFEWATTFLVDKDVRTSFLQVSSVPAYDPLPIVNASPDSSAKTIALINLSRIQGMTPLASDAEGVVIYPGWDGRIPQFTDNTLQAAMQSVVAGDTDVKTAMTQAGQKIDAQLAKKK